jgi:hypothetical protein
MLMYQGFSCSRFSALFSPIFVLSYLFLSSAGWAQPGPSSQRTDLVISEIMYSAGVGADYVELHNGGAKPINLKGYRIVVTGEGGEGAAFDFHLQRRDHAGRWD